MPDATACGDVMPYLAVGQENSAAIEIYYEDHGRGAPVVLVHGYLLDGHSWEKQEAALLAAGYRVITYDRRGFGASSRPSVGYDFRTLAADLAALVEHLDLREAVLAGFCTGTGEVTRYVAAAGAGRVRAVALIAPMEPGPGRARGHPDGNPDGVGPAVIGEFLSRVRADRPAAIKTFLDRSYNIDLLGGVRVSDQAWQNSFHVAIRASAAAVLGCAVAGLEDFCPDLVRITVPVLIVQGSQDRITPPAISGGRLSELLPQARRVLIPEGPHAIIWTHADEVNTWASMAEAELIPQQGGSTDMDARSGSRPVTDSARKPAAAAARWAAASPRSRDSSRSRLISSLSPLASFPAPPGDVVTVRA